MSAENSPSTTPTVSDRKKFFAFILLGVVALVVIASLLWLSGYPQSFLAQREKSQLRQQLLEKAARINYQGPRMLTLQVRLDSVRLHNDRFYYYYTFPKDQVDRLNLPQIEASLRRQMAQQLCQAEAMAIFRQHQVAVVFAYRDAKGKDITEFSLRPEQVC
ncbi:hypothetical protein [Idiomarina xiamenensis]|uniref:Uncharacterized protein n=1 Tax=Idiomarina xiamenensis 10-D-4 TaxID=740709 RepID=K2KAA2_9GAMM|nr:hypothetical protein [Idiomarina xiamenensis]EKE84718.1 hypothetical protein A10D4_03870 [Idiomarina xiamenensis 10-D-4]